jgi:hypothetical protein
MKKLIDNYVFNPRERTIIFSDYDVISLERVLLITNVTRGVIIYSFADPSKGGSVSGNVLFLNYDTSEMSEDDRLQIWYEDPSLPALDNGALRDLLETVASNTSNLDIPLSDLASQNTLEGLYEIIVAIYPLLQALLQTPLSKLAIDNANRLRAVIDNTVPVSQSGTWALQQSGVWMMPTYSNDNIQFLLAYIAYNECQRSKFTFA